MTKKTRKPTKPPKTARPAAKRAKAAKQVAPAKKSQPAKPPGKVYVLLGADEYAKPRAARFSAEDPELLAKAAASMYLRLVEVTTQTWPKLRPSSRPVACTPTAKDWCRISRVTCITNLLVGDTWPISGRSQIRTQRHKTCRDTWDEIAPGHLVIAREALEIGWWEAVVIERNGDLGHGRGTATIREYPPMVRHRSAIALISPAAQ